MSLGAVENTVDTSGETVMHIVIEPATTIVIERVLFAKIPAKVTLRVTKLKLENSQLTGFYETKIDTKDTPFLFKSAARKKGETGNLTLKTTSTIPELKIKGGVFKGDGYCPARNNAHRDIICNLTPDKDNGLVGTAILIIDSGKHVLNFTSRYRVITDADEIKRVTAKVVYSE